MNSNYPQFIPPLSSLLKTGKLYIIRGLLSVNRISFRKWMEKEPPSHRSKKTSSKTSTPFENLIRHRLRSPLPGKNLHRRRENKFHAPKNCKQAGGRSWKYLFPSAIPLAASRVQPGGSSNTNCQTDLVKHGAITGLTRGRATTPP